MQNNFSNRCYEILKKVPKGKITTYKGLAKALGNPKSYRAVGNAMNRNPHAPRVPCHRVVKSNGKVGGFAHGTNKKVSMLKKEGIPIKNGMVMNFENYLYIF